MSPLFLFAVIPVDSDLESAPILVTLLVAIWNYTRSSIGQLGVIQVADGRQVTPDVLTLYHDSLCRWDCRRCIDRCEPVYDVLTGLYRVAG